MVVGHENHYIKPNSTTCGVFFQNGDPWENRDFYDLIPAKKIFWGPFDFYQYLNQPDPLLEFITGVRVLLEHEAQTKNCHARGPAQCLVFPLGVDTDLWLPRVPRGHRTTPLLFIKDSVEYVPPTDVTLELFEKNGINAYSVIKTHRSGEGGYTESQFRDALEQAPFMVALIPTEEHNTFLDEAFSMVKRFLLFIL